MNKWIDCNKPFNDIAKAGMVVLLEGGEEVLVGDVNHNGGVCDCCTVVDSDKIVVKYKIVWEKFPEGHDEVA